MALTTAGINAIAQNIIGQGIAFNGDNTYLGVGTGTAAFNSSQTDLQSVTKFRKKVDAGFPVATPPSIKFRSTFAYNEANFAWNEWGIFNAATGGTMLNRVVESNGTKQSNQTWVLEVDVTFSIGE